MSRRLLAAVALAAGLCGCRDQVTLGAWLTEADAGSGGVSGSGGASSFGGSGGAAEGGAPSDAGAAGMAGEGPASLPGCLEPGVAGPLTATSTSPGVTETATDWIWPEPVTSMKWELMVEREVVRPTPTSPPTSGYYYAHQFSFLEGVAGFLGIQAEGGYQLDPPSSPVEFTKIAVFWLSGPPIAGELGDIPYPDARVAPATAAGVNFLTIHARFDWQACRVYRFRVGPHATEPDGSIWYAAFIEDTSTGVEIMLGRMLLPADVGSFSPLSISRAIPINFEPITCSALAQASVVFGPPTTEDGELRAEFSANRFVDPGRCTASRFTPFPGGIRHELGIAP